MFLYMFIYLSRLQGAAVAEWLSSWLAEQEDRGSIPRLATWIFRDWLSPASKSRYGWKIAKSTLIKTTKPTKHITPPTSFSQSRHSIDVTWRHTLSPRCTQRQKSVTGINWNAYYRLNKGWWRDKFVIRSVSDVLRAQSRLVKCVGGSACGLTPHKFY